MKLVLTTISNGLVVRVSGVSRSHWENRQVRNCDTLHTVGDQRGGVRLLNFFFVKKIDPRSGNATCRFLGAILIGQ